MMMIPSVSMGQVGLAGGGARDYIRLGGEGDWEQLKSPLVGFSYDVVMDQEYGLWGLSFGYRGAQDGILISQFHGEAWRVLTNGMLELFAGGQFETWGRIEVEGEKVDTKFLGGARGGLRFPVPGVESGSFEVSGNYSKGQDEAEHAGFVFGLRLVDQPSEDEEE
jgi:hypothetical protein